MADTSKQVHINTNIRKQSTIITIFINVLFLNWHCVYNHYQADWRFEVRTNSPEAWHFKSYWLTAQSKSLDGVRSSQFCCVNVDPDNVLKRFTKVEMPNQICGFSELWSFKKSRAKNSFDRNAWTISLRLFIDGWYMHAYAGMLTHWPPRGRRYQTNQTSKSDLRQAILCRLQCFCRSAYEARIGSVKISQDVGMRRSEMLINYL